MTTKRFDPIDLSEMDKVKLMNRVDRKYWFNHEKLQEVLDVVKDDYYIMHIEGNGELPYSSVYFETPNDEMYIQHHNGKLNRCKIRRRTYLVSGISFLELKFKNNKGRTEKKRILTESGLSDFSQKECDFITAFTAYNPHDLIPVLENSFTRLTLVNKNFNERCTIDVDLNYKSRGLDLGLNNLVIVELKSDGDFRSSPLAIALLNKRIKPAGFSKYCVGRSFTDPSLKQNSFKGKLRQIGKTININNN